MTASESGIGAQLPLADIHLPAAISYWPLAIGWWLALFVVLALIFLLVVLFLRWKRSPVTAALIELKQLSSQDSHSEAELLTQCDQLLRRTAMALYGREQVAGLSGKRWQNFLLKSGHLSENRFSLPLDQQYRPNPQINRTQLIANTRKWLKTQRRLGMRRDRKQGVSRV